VERREDRRCRCHHLLRRSAGSAGVLTPHSGELGRLLGLSALDIEKDRFGAARDASRRTGAIVLLKGARTIVADGDDVWVNVTGNPALATAGSGDVLAGIVAGLACTLPPRRAAGAGAFVHGRAADVWRSEHHGADRGMIASDIAARVPSILGELLRRA
jgi:NAD(P)H-hydrate epimerase